MTVFRLRIADGAGGTRDGLVDATPTTALAEVMQAASGIGLPLPAPVLSGRHVEHVRTLDEVGLVHGDVLGDDAGPAVPRRPGRFVVAVSGPLAGAFWPLPTGATLHVGRSADADVRINDGLVSNRHCTITDHGVDGVQVADTGSSNGTFVEGEEATAPRLLPTGAYMQVGSTVLTVLEVTAQDLPVESPPSSGARPFQRHFRPAVDALPERIAPPDPPRDGASVTGRSWWQYLLPLASGAGMALITGRWQFLLIIAIAPIAMLVQYVRQQRRDEEERLADEADYERRLVEHRQEVAAVRAVEQRRRRRAAIVGGEAVLMAQLRHRRLWERMPSDDDHAMVCVGLATQPSMVEASAEQGVRDDLWAVPLSVPLAETGSLLVRGEMGRARAVGRSMLLNLAATHSPLELRVSVLTAEGSEVDWDWVRWLPHAFADRGAARVYSTVDARDRAVNGLLQGIESREEAGTTSPVEVVLVDGAQQVPTGRLTSLLRRGADVGVYCVVLDDRVTPEGVQGTLQLGAQPDEGVFESRDLPRVDGILTAELAVTWAERAALSLAGLRPAADDSGGPAAEIHLTDLLADDSVDVPWVQARWAMPPVEQVVVGQSGRSPTAIDIVRHGPHAIVGGATRSGKTEFLLTWITSLCLHNDPDDLAVIIADFKGGVDHKMTAKLPHVMSLATNQDIRGFERTLVMLEAEIRRRQNVLDSAGASNIEAYRTARERDDSLVAVPRLLVVVDEFSELRQADKDTGGGYMHRLESVARVGAGLGVHLVLVTQNFSGGQLSDQIDGQVGLGVCFRVEKDEHSKVVLRSPVATTVPASRPGRAWARLRGQDLVELQSARVAGRRRDLGTDKADLIVELVPFSTMAAGLAAAGGGNVPHAETDLAVLIDVTNEAAAGRRPPMPWPPELDPSTTLAELLARARRGGASGAPIALADVPSRQHQVLTTLTDDDQLVSVIGSSSRERIDFVSAVAVADVLGAPPAARHVYAIDLEGSSLSVLDDFPHVGAVASLDDSLALRIIRRLTEEVGRRRTLFESSGTSGLADYERRVGALPRIRLIVNGADRLVASSESDASPLLRPLASLIKDAGGTGLQILLAGGPSLHGRKMVERATRRFVMALNDPAVYTVVGVGKSRAVDLAPSGRAYDAANDCIVQIGRLDGEGASRQDVIARLAQRVAAVMDDADGPEPLPEIRWPLAWARLDPSSLVVPRGYGAAVPAGVDTDTGRWLWLDLEEDGPVVLVGGDRRSGRSTMLAAMARLADGLGWDVQIVAPSARSGVSSLAEASLTVVSELDALEAPGEAPTLYLVDDAHRLDDSAPLAKLIEDAEDNAMVVLAGPVDALGPRTGVMRALPEHRSTITLAPSTSNAAGGGRVPDRYRRDPRPGLGVAFVAGQFSGVQIPLPSFGAEVTG